MTILRSVTRLPSGGTGVAAAHLQPAKLTVRRNSDGQDIVGDLVKVPLKTYDEFEDLYQ